MKEITHEEFLAANNIVIAYWKQIDAKKEARFKELTDGITLNMVVFEKGVKHLQLDEKFINVKVIGLPETAERITHYDRDLFLRFLYGRECKNPTTCEKTLKNTCRRLNKTWGLKLNVDEFVEKFTPCLDYLTK